MRAKINVWITTEMVGGGYNARRPIYGYTGPCVTKTLITMHLAFPYRHHTIRQFAIFAIAVKNVCAFEIYKGKGKKVDVTSATPTPKWECVFDGGGGSTYSAPACRRVRVASPSYNDACFFLIYYGAIVCLRVRAIRPAVSMSRVNYYCRIVVNWSCRSTSSS